MASPSRESPAFLGEVEGRRTPLELSFTGHLGKTDQSKAAAPNPTLESTAPFAMTAWTLRGEPSSSRQPPR
jgi:hypothetical protein